MNRKTLSRTAWIGALAGVITAAVLWATGSTSNAATIPSATASSVVSGFQTAGLPVSGVIMYTAATDPNHLLGRPGGYLSKTSFVDMRIPADQIAGLTPGSVGCGGTVEVYATATEAQARVAYIKKWEKAMPALGTEYDYVGNTTVVRLSQLLTPDQAAAYAPAP